MDDSLVGAGLNPWWAVWAQPRLTLRHILADNPRMHFWVLVIFYGVVRAGAWGVRVGLGDLVTPPGVAAFILAFGPMLGIAVVYLVGGLLRSLCQSFGGRAEGQQVRTVLAWASMPLTVLTVMGLLPFLFLLGQRLFSPSDPLAQRLLYEQSLNPFGTGLNAWRTIMDTTGLMYFVIISAVGLSEIEQFSLLKAVGVLSIVVGGLLLVALLIAFVGSLF